MRYLSAFLVWLFLFLASYVYAGNSDSKAQQNLYEQAPIYTHNARNVQRITVNLTYDNFRNVRIEEAEDFDGYSAKVELIVPFGRSKSWEMRLDLPFYTKGDASSIDTEQNIDIDGNGGIFDFASLIVQKEISTVEKSTVNTSAYFGYGYRTASLETSIDDPYNHRGQVARLGFNIDNARKDRDIRLQTTLDIRYYFDTDDLNPSDDGETFSLVNVSGAAVYNTDCFIKPIFELLYSTDFNQRHIVQTVPELLIPVGHWLEIKGGYAFGHSRGEGVTETATLRTTFMF
jgi:hypothetical protein